MADNVVDLLSDVEEEVDREFGEELKGVEKSVVNLDSENYEENTVSNDKNSDKGERTEKPCQFQRGEKDKYSNEEKYELVKVIKKTQS